MNIIVPTDFLPVSLNAAQFAARMLTGQYEATLVLYHVYEGASAAEEARTKLQQLKDQLLDESIVKIECVAEESSDFVESLDRKIRYLDAGLVVMAVNDKSKLEQVISPSSSLRVIEKNLCPVLVIPENVKYNEIKNVALASDFKDVQNSIPLVPVKKVLNIFRPKVHIVNINSEIYVSLNEEYLEQRKIMLDMFHEFNPECYFITTYDFHETLHQFIKDKNIDMVLTFPRKHSFLNNLIKGSATKKLVFESAVPVLAAHE